MSSPQAQSPLHSSELSFDGISTKSLISDDALRERDIALVDIELENLKEPEEEPYHYLDIKGDREELGSVESIISEEDVGERNDALHSLLLDEERETLTVDKLVTHNAATHDTPVTTSSLNVPHILHETHGAEINSNDSELSVEDQDRIERELHDAEELLNDDVLLESQLVAGDVLRVVTPPASSSSSSAAAIPPCPFPKDSQIAVYWHPYCARHYVPEHPEQPARVKVILQALRNHFQETIAFRESQLVKDEYIRLFHTEHQLGTFQRTWMSTQEAFAKRQTVTYGSLDGDTKAMWATRDATYAAVGAVIDAITHVCATPEGDALRVDSAFCCVRPPGHHAERDRSQGFCFFNNIGIGAKYAQRVLGLQRVAVLDFDVHHGNGTEDGFKDDEALFYGSTHERDAYPGTGVDPSPFVGAQAQNPLHRRIVNRTLSPGPKSREEFHTKWGEVLDEMVLFRPELILISAGFDAHDDDELSNAEFTEDDFEWATEEIFKAGLRINPQSPPKIVSVLEGGYDLNAISRSSIKHVEVLKKGYYHVLEDLQLAKGKDIEKDFHGDAALALQDYMQSLQV